MIFFATDLHGSEVCFRKFLKAGRFYGADVLFLGGDYGAKELVLFARTKDGVTVLGGSGECHSFASPDFERYSLWCKASGRLLKQMDMGELKEITPSSYRELFDRSLQETFDTWGELARKAYREDGTSIYVIPGNDDPPETDHCFEGAPYIFMHRRLEKLESGISVLGWGGSNPTPWRTPREYAEGQIKSELEDTFKDHRESPLTVLFVHPPPLRSGLDLAPQITDAFSYRLSLGSTEMIPIGSYAVRSFVEEHQPTLGLFGHVHEGRGHQMIGRTLCINPGSAFYSGRLLGCIVKITQGHVDDFQFTEG